MANSTKKIVRGVRFDGKTYVPGMEDELANVLPAEDAVRLTSAGHIEGSWATNIEPPAKPTGKAESEKGAKEK